MAPLTDWASHRIYTTCTALIRVCHVLFDTTTVLHSDLYLDTTLEESIPALDSLRKAGKTKYIGLSECSAQTLRKANSSK